MAFPASITEHFTNELGLEVHVFNLSRHVEAEAG